MNNFANQMFILLLQKLHCFIAEIAHSIWHG